ncbi:FadR/GntR family transcriptional regulator [Halovulum sp. GXIMD14794]
MPDKGFMSRRALWQAKLAEEVMQGIAHRIRTGDLAPGHPVPDRHELASSFVTSETVAERALGLLVDEELAAPGPDGTLIVAARSPRGGALTLPPASDTTREDVIALVELRLGVESEGAALAAERRTDTQLDEIRGAALAYENAAGAEQAPAAADYGFHLAVARATGNAYIEELTEYLGPLIIPRMRVSLTSAGTFGDRDLSNSRAEHRAIVEAIAASDPEAARAAMLAHLGRTLELVKGSPPDSERA